MGGYGIFAKFYDLLSSNIDYKSMAEYYNDFIMGLGGKQGKIVDLACGTGSLSLELVKLGYDVIGVDYSAEMLAMAAAKSMGILLLQQDITRLRLFDKVDYAVCALDSLNHLSSYSNFTKAIKSTATCLKTGGLFLFDVNTIYKHKNVLGDNTFIYDLDQVFCSWQNEFDGDRTVSIQLDLFEKLKGESYLRHQEVFSEIAFSQREIEKALTDCGFELIGCYDYLTKNPPLKESEKLVFVARKL